MLTRLAIAVPLLAAWGACTYGVLGSSDYLACCNLDRHSLCGVWGCGPPLSDLLPWHGFCLLLTAPPAVAAAMWLPASMVKKTGQIAACLAIAVVIGLLVWEACTWLPQTSPHWRKYFGHRFLFSLMTKTDLPILPGLVWGAALIQAGRWRNHGT